MMTSNLYFFAFLISFVSTFLLLVFFIPVLRYFKYGQSIRLEGPKEHYKKSGTPTMGGIFMTLGFILPFLGIGIGVLKLSFQTCLLFILPPCFYMMIGFIDDYLIIVRKNNQGLTPKMKIILQIIGVVLYYFIFLQEKRSTTIDLYFLKVDLKWAYGIFILLIFLGSSNAVNLSDGLDGLATGLSIISFIAIAFIAYFKENQVVLLFSIVTISSLMAFLLFNANPAKIFMGDSGSLMLGATLANLMILLEEEILLVLVGLAFVIETLSVILQVLYFKITKGKRIFLMSPLHHHFELKGYTEWQVDLIFWLIALLACSLAIMIVLL